MGNFFKKLAGLDRQSKIEIENFNKDEEKEIENILDRNENDENNNDEWLGEEEDGQLSIDVYQTPQSIIIKSTIAGVKPEDIDISVNNDMITIRGKREEKNQIKEENYLFKECYWGSFSRSIILPVEIEAEKIEALLENGVLTITLPKAKNAKQISIKVKEK